MALFEELGLDTGAQAMQRALAWLTHQGAEHVDELRELPAGTYTCKELADALGLPLIKAQRLLGALEGAPGCPGASASGTVPCGGDRFAWRRY